MKHRQPFSHGCEGDMQHIQPVYHGGQSGYGGVLYIPPGWVWWYPHPAVYATHHPPWVHHPAPLLLWASSLHRLIAG